MPIASFPQPYLGLPLSVTKLCLADFQPLIARIDKRLAGWRGHLLSSDGRLALINSVVSALPSYMMGAILLPKGVITAIDKRRRAFFWTGEENCHNGNCKIVWNIVCSPKAKGGAGIKNLETQNIYLLQKFLLKMHEGDSAPWIDHCFRDHYGWSASCDLGDLLRLDTIIWKDIVTGLTHFRSISKSIIGDGRFTSFWFDNWIGGGTLFQLFLALFSHATRPNISIADALARS